MSTSLIDEIDQITEDANLSQNQSISHNPTGSVHLEPIVPKKKKRRKKKQNQDNIEMKSMNNESIDNESTLIPNGMTQGTTHGIENPSFESKQNQTQPNITITNPTIEDVNNNTLDNDRTDEFIQSNEPQPNPPNGMRP